MKKTQNKENVTREINAATPKSHLKLIKNFCEKKDVTRNLGKVKNTCIRMKQDILAKQKDYFDNGTIPDLKTMRAMFQLTITAQDMAIKNFDDALSRAADLKEIEKTLKSKGYNTREIYSKYKKSMDFDDMVEAATKC